MFHGTYGQKSNWKSIPTFPTLSDSTALIWKPRSEWMNFHPKICSFTSFVARHIYSNSECWNFRGWRGWSQVWQDFESNKTRKDLYCVPQSGSKDKKNCWRRNIKYVATLFWLTTLKRTFPNTKKASSQMVCTPLLSILCTKSWQICLKRFVSGEIWLGLEAVHKITSMGNYSLHILLKDFDQKTYVAVFDQFEVMMTMMLNLMNMLMQVGPGDDYVLTIGGFNAALSTLGDAMTSHDLKFTTK